MNNTKDLWTSKTFWFALLSKLIGIAVIAGAVTAADGQVLQANLTQIIEGVFMIVSGGGALYGRIKATEMIRRPSWWPL